MMYVDALKSSVIFTNGMHTCIKVSSMIIKIIFKIKSCDIDVYVYS